jgi:hypothetical protein
MPPAKSIRGWVRDENMKVASSPSEKMLLKSAKNAPRNAAK